ncbi:MAG: hypothetical protein AB1486_15450 [Planctomycetota bacterium]
MVLLGALGGRDTTALEPLGVGILCEAGVEWIVGGRLGVEDGARCPILGGEGEREAGGLLTRGPGDEGAPLRADGLECPRDGTGGDGGRDAWEARGPDAEAPEGRAEGAEDERDAPCMEAFESFELEDPLLRPD